MQVLQISAAKICFRTTWNLLANTHHKLHVSVLTNQVSIMQSVQDLLMHIWKPSRLSYMPDDCSSHLLCPSTHVRRTNRLHKCNRTHPSAYDAHSVEPFKPECEVMSIDSHDWFVSDTCYQGCTNLVWYWLSYNQRGGYYESRLPWSPTNRLLCKWRHL